MLSTKTAQGTERKIHLLAYYGSSSVEEVNTICHVLCCSLFNLPHPLPLGPWNTLHLSLV